MSTCTHVAIPPLQVIYDASNHAVEERLTVAVNVSSLPSVVAFPSSGSLQVSRDRRCAFSRQRGRWLLKGDCDLSAAITVPRNVTLDGGGHTITLVGDAEAFESAAIRTNGGDIVQVTVDGSSLLPLAPAYFAALALAAPGGVSETTVRNVQFDGAPHSAVGIEVAVFEGAHAHVADVRLENISGTGLLLTGNGRATVERIFSTGVSAAIQASGGIEAHLSQAVAEGASIGVLAQDQSCVRIAASDSPGERIAEDQGLIHQDTLSFIGAGDREQARRRTALAAHMSRDRLG